MIRITATEAARNFSAILNRIAYEGEEFTIERNGEAVAEIKAAKQNLTVGRLAQKLKETPLPDTGFAEDMQRIISPEQELLSDQVVEAESASKAEPVGS